MSEETRGYCRACKNIIRGTFTDMKSEYHGTFLGILYFECTGIDPEKDGFSQVLCQTCERTLIFSYQFMQMCKKTQDELEGEVNNVTKEEEIENCEKVPKEEDPLQQVGEQIEEDSRKIYMCDLCDKKFDTFSQINTHIEENHKPIICEICKSSLPNSHSYKQHYRLCKRQIKLKTTICNYCNKIYSNVSVLNRHMRTVHENIRDFSCNICEKSFTLKTHLIAHQAVHSTTRDFKCEICSLAFKTEAALKVHQNAHTATRDYVCDICGSNFTTITYLKIHMETHTTTRNFVCDKCNKSFKSLKYLRFHGRAHMENAQVKCHVCAKEFKNKYSLSNHMREHFGEAAKCPDCGQTFANKSLFKDHWASKHEKVRRFKCEYEGCGLAYFTGSHLRYHVKSVHLGLPVRKEKSFDVLPAT